MASTGLGRLTLNLPACNLIEDFDSYKYAQLLTDTQPNGKTCIGILLLREKAENSIKITKRLYKGEYARSFSLNNKSVMEKLFGIRGTQNKVTNYPVEKDANEPNLLVIRNV